MNSFTLHQSALIRGIYQKLGRVQEAEEHVRSVRAAGQLRLPIQQANLRVREVKQYAWNRIYSEVLGGDPEATKLFEEGEAEGFTPAKGVEQALGRLTAGGIPAAIISESSSLAAAIAITRFLGVHNLYGFFAEIITPAGRFKVNGERLGSEFEGKTKREGTIYDELKA